MKFSVVGENSAALRLITEILRSAEHSLSSCSIFGGLHEDVCQGQLPVRLTTTAEEALLAGDVDVAVLAIDDPEETLRLARAASQAGRHVVVVPPSSCSPAFSFELHLIFDEARSNVIPLSHRFQLERLGMLECELVIDSSQTMQVSCEMPVATSSDRELRKAMERGLDLLAAFALRYNQVTVLESRAPQGEFLSRLITLNSSAAAELRLPPATLTLKPVAASSAQTPSLRITQPGGTELFFVISEETPLLPRLLVLLSNRELCSQWLSSYSTILELVESAEKSLRRRRTVDVHFDSGSERGVFKSHMTAIGCGVLTFMLFGMVGYLILGQLVELPKWVLHTARILWIAPLVLFLLAQLLLPVSRDRTHAER